MTDPPMGVRRRRGPGFAHSPETPPQPSTPADGDQPSPTASTAARSGARKTAHSRLFNIRLRTDTEHRFAAALDALQRSGVTTTTTEAIHALMDATTPDELRERLRSYRQRRSAL